MWITVNVLGDPDNGVILASYLGSFLMAGAFLAIGSCISALTKNQVIAFIVAALICFLFVMSGLELVQNALRAWTPDVFVTAVSSMSFLSHFERITQRRARPADARLLLLDDCLLAVRRRYLGRSEESAVRLAHVRSICFD